MEKKNKKNRIQFSMNHREILSQLTNIPVQVKAKTHLRDQIERLLLQIIHQSQLRAAQKKQTVVKYDDIANELFNNPKYQLLLVAYFNNKKQ